MMDKKKYTYQSVSDEQLMASEPSVAYPNSISQVDALGTLKINQTESVQRILEERLHNRIMISEQQFAYGELKSQNEVNKDIEALFEAFLGYA